MSERNIGLGGTEVQINIPVFITNGDTLSLTRHRGQTRNTQN